MTTQTVLATANVLRDLGRNDARVALAGLLELEPDLVGLQEWEWTPSRLRVLRETGSVGVVPDLHLRCGSAAGGSYRGDRPLLAARHAREVAALQRIVDEQLDLGRVVYAMGDSNFHGLRLSGLTSAWEGHETEPGSHGGTRQIDDVHGPGRAVSLTLLTNKSDHMAVVVRREAEQ